jgi:hypothetical protein
VLHQTATAVAVAAGGSPVGCGQHAGLLGLGDATGYRCERRPMQGGQRQREREFDGLMLTFLDLN